MIMSYTSLGGQKWSGNQRISCHTLVNRYKYRSFYSVFLLVLVLGGVRIQGQTALDGANSVSSLSSDTSQVQIFPDFGPHHRRVETVMQVQTTIGDFIEITNRYIQLEPGISYWDDQTQRWEESRPIIEVGDGFATAWRGQIKAWFSANLNSPDGSVDIVKNGLHLKCSPLALVLRDRVQGKRVVIANVVDTADSTVEIIGESEIIYKDVFDHLKASIRFSVSRSGLEQDLLLEQPISVEFIESQGLIPEATYLELMTEFFEAPEPVRNPRLLASVTDPVLRQRMASPDWVDENLEFQSAGDSIHIGAGRAFGVDEQGEGLSSVVGKEWIHDPATGRRVLVESIDLIEALPEMERIFNRESSVHGSQSGTASASSRPTYNQRMESAFKNKSYQAHQTVTALNLPVRKLAQKAIKPRMLRASNETRTGPVYICDYLVC
jgi:hypothetical protein